MDGYRQRIFEQFAENMEKDGKLKKINYVNLGKYHIPLYSISTKVLTLLKFQPSYIQKAKNENNYEMTKK